MKIPIDLKQQFGSTVAEKLHATMTILGYFETSLIGYNQAWRKAAIKGDGFLGHYLNNSAVERFKQGTNGLF